MRLCCLASLFVFIFVFVEHATFADAASLPDPALQACVQGLYKKFNWQSAQDVTDIRCHKKNIRSLSGIDQFVNLETLSVYNNKITDATLPRLKKLKAFNIARNSIAKLTIDALPSLEKLYVFSNKIEHLRLTKLPKLKLIKANTNGMETFQYSGLPSLEKIYLFNNDIEHIDIYQLPSLVYMDCRQNPMSDELYEEMDAIKTATILHDGNADDW